MSSVRVVLSTTHFATSSIAVRPTVVVLRAPHSAQLADDCDEKKVEHLRRQVVSWCRELDWLPITGASAGSRVVDSSGVSSRVVSARPVIGCRRSPILPIDTPLLADRVNDLLVVVAPPSPD